MHRDHSRSFRKPRRNLATAITLAVTLLGTQVASWAAGGSARNAAPVAEADHAASAPNEAAPAPRSPSMDQTYAARETKTKGLETFKGGDVVIIGSGGLVLVLLIILIIVIL